MTILKIEEMLNSISCPEFNDRLPSKNFYDSVSPEKAKATVGAVAFIDETESSSLNSISDMECRSNPILADRSYSINKIGLSMSKNFIQLSRSETTLDILSKDPKAFLLLTWISLRAHRAFDPLSELEEGECFISEKTTPGECGLTPKEYRGAKTRLIKAGILKETFNPVWLKKERSEKPRTNPELEIFKKRAIKRATKCCIVKLCTEDIYDINVKSKGDQKGEKRASKGRAKGDRQEEEELEEYKKKTSTPLPPKRGVDEVFFQEPEKEEKIHVHREVYMTSKEIEDCIKVHGSREAVSSVIDRILDWPGRKYPIRNWPDNIKKWEVKEVKIKNLKEENKRFSKDLEKVLGGVLNGWTASNFLDKKKDCEGLLFELVGGAVSKYFFFPYSEADFKEKVQKFICEKKINLNQSHV